LAAQGDYINMVQFLLKAGADADFRNRSGHTPLDLATRKGHTAIVNLLNQDTKKEIITIL
jgi:ankyrin repeat protein